MLSERLQLGLSSPITAGVILAMALPWLFWSWEVSLGRPGLFLRPLAGLAVLLALIGLAWTQSRGPLLAAIAVILAKMFGLSGDRRIKRHIAIAFIFLIAASLLTNGAARLMDALSNSDGSVLNRWGIWKAAWPIISNAGIRGLGSNESGPFYSQWFSPPENPYLYAQVFNNWLEICGNCGCLAGISYALGAAAIAAVPGYYIVTPLNLDGTVNHWAKAYWAAYLTLVTFLLATITTSIVEVSVVTIMAALNLVLLAFIIVIKAVRRTDHVLGLSLALVCVALICLPLWVSLGYRSSGVNVRLAGTQLTLNRMQAVTPTGHRSALVLVDRYILGDLYGKNVRRLLDQARDHGTMIVADPRYPLGRETMEADSVILFGSSARLLGRFDGEPRVEMEVVAPTVAPPAVPRRSLARIWLLKEDISGVNALWIKWAGDLAIVSYLQPLQDPVAAVAQTL